MKDFGELKDRKLKIRKEFEELSTKPAPSLRPTKNFHKKQVTLPRPRKLAQRPSNTSSTDLDEFEIEIKRTKKRTVVKNTWYDSLINHIQKTIKRVF